MTTAEKAKCFALNTYAKYDIEITKGKGSYIWDSNDKKYLDFYSGHAVSILGHCHENVQKAITDQCQKLMFYSNIFEMEQSSTLAEKITSTLLPEKYLAYFANSGSEANETALKIARKYTDKTDIISFNKSFHGRGMYPLSVTGMPAYHQFSPDFDSYTSFAELGNMQSVENCFTEKTAAIICEPIQSIGGVNMAEKKFYQDLQQFCKEKNIVLIVDEIQTGLGRTAETFWLSQSLGITPDILTSAKGIASGLPLSSVLISKKIADTIGVGEHATTFGGGPVVCSAANATLDIITADGFLETIHENAQYLRHQLEKKYEVFGKGFLLGVKTEKTASEIVKKCLDAGVIIGTSGNKNIARIMPPINVSKQEIDQFLSIFNTI